ncbi:MAG: hypothetical protein AAGD38_16395, partial [Acidobacteriota bacterium]
GILEIEVAPDFPAASDAIRVDASVYTTACSSGIEIEIDFDRIDIWSLEPCECLLPAFIRQTRSIEIGTRPAGEIDVHFGYRYTEPTCGPIIEEPLASESFFVGGEANVITTTTPQFPRVGEDVALDVDYLLGCAVGSVEIARDDRTVRILGLEDFCPEVPPPYSFQALLGDFDSGSWILEISLDCPNPDPMNPFSCQDTGGPRMIARRALEVGPIAFSTPQLIPAEPRSDEPFEFRFLSSCPVTVTPSELENGVVEIEVAELPLGAPAPCTDPPSYDNGIQFGPWPPGDYLVIASGPDDPQDGSNELLFYLPFSITPADTAVEVGDGRFEIAATWRDFDGGTGSARGGELGGDAAGMWFFDDDNIELVVKVLDGCDENGHFWVFASGLTTVETSITVTDTDTGATWSYTNPLGNRFDLVNDLEAFSCAAP